MSESVTPLAAIDAAIRHWSSLSALATFAIAKHGFGDSNGGFGVEYPGDQDEYDRMEYGPIPSGFVRVYGFWGPPEGYEIEVPEFLYLQQLAIALSDAGLDALSQQIKALQANEV